MNDNSQPVFFISNHERQERFRIETRIWRGDNGLYAEKRAVTDIAQPHLYKMLKTFESLSAIRSLMKLTAIIPAQKLSSGSLGFSFVEGLTAERVLVDTITQKDESATKQIIDQVIAIIDALPTVEATHKDKLNFEKIFGNSFSGESQWTNLSVVDFNLDNFIIDKDGKWHLFDYEWTFDTSIPKKMLKLRFLWFFFHRHREILQYHAQSIASVKLSNELYIPHYIYDHYKSFFSDLHKSKAAETRFQAHVTVQNNLQTPTETTPFEVKEADVFTDGIERFVKKKLKHNIAPYKQQLKKLQDELKNANDNNNKLRREIEVIRGSKAYKVSRKLGDAKNKIIKKEP